MLWILFAVVVVLALVVLGGLAYGLLGAFGRLRREIEGAEQDLRPFLEQLQRTADRAAQVSERRATSS